MRSSSFSTRTCVHGNHVTPQEVLIQLAVIIAQTKGMMCTHTTWRIHIAYTTQVKLDEGRTKTCPLITKCLCCPMYLEMSDVDPTNSDSDDFPLTRKAPVQEETIIGSSSLNKAFAYWERKKVGQKAMSLTLPRPFCPLQPLIVSPFKAKKRKVERPLALYPSPIVTNSPRY